MQLHCLGTVIDDVSHITSRIKYLILTYTNTVLRRLSSLTKSLLPLQAQFACFTGNSITGGLLFGHPMQIFLYRSGIRDPNTDIIKVKLIN